MARVEMVVHLSAHTAIVQYGVDRLGAVVGPLPRRDLAELDLGYRDLVGLRPREVLALIAVTLAC